MNAAARELVAALGLEPLPLEGGFALAGRDTLRDRFPDHGEIIRALTR